MVVTIQIVGGRRVTDNIQRITNMLPEGVGQAAKEFGQSLQRRLKREVTVKRLVWRGRLHSNIRWRMTSKTSGQLTMPRHGAFLDSMKPHFVKLSRRRLINQWAREKGNPAVKAQAKREGVIFVKPHPFIRGPLDRTIRDLNKILQRHVSNVVKSRGRRT